MPFRDPDVVVTGTLISDSSSCHLSVEAQHDFPRVLIEAPRHGRADVVNLIHEKVSA